MRKRGEMKEKTGVFNVRGSCKVRRGLGRGGKVTGKVTIIYLITDPSDAARTHTHTHKHKFPLAYTHLLSPTHLFFFLFSSNTRA